MKPGVLLDYRTVFVVWANYIFLISFCSRKLLRRICLVGILTARPGENAVTEEDDGRTSD